MIECSLKIQIWDNPNPADIYLLKANNKNIRIRCEICLKLTIKTPERSPWHKVFFAKIVINIHFLTIFGKILSSMFDWVLNTPLVVISATKSFNKVKTQFLRMCKSCSWDVEVLRLWEPPVIIPVEYNPLSANPTKWSNTLTIHKLLPTKLLTILSDWRLTGQGSAYFCHSTISQKHFIIATIHNVCWTYWGFWTVSRLR